MIFPEFVGGVHLPPLVPYIALAGTIGFILMILPGLIWIERVVIALMQDRSGPNRVGPRGLLQSTADVVKLFFKEDMSPKSADIKIYYLAPFLTVLCAFSAGGVLPLQTLTFHLANGDFQTVPLTVGDVNIGVLYILAVSSLQVYGVVLAGWASNNKYSLLGGLRGSAQLISYELSMGLAILCVVLFSGTCQLNKIVDAQSGAPFGLPLPEIFNGSIFSWFWLGTGIIPVVIYTIAMIAETNRAPFDLPEAESELIAGFHTEYSSMKFAMFFTGEYVSMLVVSGLNAALFWGGPLPPLNIIPFTLIPGFVWFITKVMGGIFFYTWLRATYPRLRYDALMHLGWKRMLPLGLVWLFLLAVVSLGRSPAKSADNVPEKPVTATQQVQTLPNAVAHR